MGVDILNLIISPNTGGSLINFHLVAFLLPPFSLVLIKWHLFELMFSVNLVLFSRQSLP